MARAHLHGDGIAFSDAARTSNDKICKYSTFKIEIETESTLTVELKQVVSRLLRYRRRSEKLALQTQVVEYRKELSKISQVDEFAKYSKVQRKLRVTTDQLSSISRQDLELNFKYVLVAQALAWLIAVIFGLRLLYQLYAYIMFSIGYH